jgi:hypothetical protein
MGENGGNDEWTEHRAELIERFMQTEGPTITPSLFSSVREHDIPGRIADRLTNAF